MEVISYTCLLHEKLSLHTYMYSLYIRLNKVHFKIIFFRLLFIFFHRGSIHTIILISIVQSPLCSLGKGFGLVVHSKKVARCMKMSTVEQICFFVI